MSHTTWRDQITVELIPELCAGTDLSIANIARVSFNKWKDQQDISDDNLIRYLANHGHSSPFRHVNISVRCSAPIHLARQLVKHQIGLSWNEVSRRYVKEPVELFNQEFRAAPQGSIKQGSAGVIDEDLIPSVKMGDHFHINSIMEAMLKWYDECIEQGVAPETVRGYMPQNMMTSWVWTGSLMAFAHMYLLRSESHAQKEANVFAEKLSTIIEPMFPVAWHALLGVDAFKKEQWLRDIIEEKQ
jgi:thymidylate synthase (FAD)